MFKKTIATLMAAASLFSFAAFPVRAGGGSGIVLDSLTLDCDNQEITYHGTIYASTAGDYQVYYYINGMTIDVNTYTLAEGSVNEITITTGIPSDPDVYSGHLTLVDTLENSYESEYIEFDTNDCSSEGSEEPEETNDSDEDSDSHKNVFSEDKRCHATTPKAVSWVKFNGKELLWSAMGGDKIEVRFSENASDLRWSFTSMNDGHEVLNQMKNTGKMSGKYYFQIRTINGCKSGPWSETFVGYF